MNYPIEPGKKELTLEILDRELAKVDGERLSNLAAVEVIEEQARAAREDYIQWCEREIENVKAEVEGFYTGRSEAEQKLQDATAGLEQLQARRESLRGDFMVAMAEGDTDTSEALQTEIKALRDEEIPKAEKSIGKATKALDKAQLPSDDYLVSRNSYLKKLYEESGLQLKPVNRMGTGPAEAVAGANEALVRLREAEYPETQLGKATAKFWKQNPNAYSDGPRAVSLREKEIREMAGSL